ncbi:two-component system response regulator [candidate division LCP-89 bacterium B3_LCP]|uniref:Two-component system response regulator n=1 Tax=candidate division LCP-89 bacterium B3_LCP TaxID=2012998 RepID=A0A532UUE9_UNCL8|nr:MAG: two-component system response regulator [candidate division LCP-89 bacterium B3_LCP]
MKKRILVVDDEKNLRILYKEELKEDGYDVQVADSAETAFKILDKQEFDAIVLDVQMPGMNGLEAMGHMLHKNRKQAIILNTAYSQFKDDFESWSADAYVVKSSDLSELKEKLRELVG